MIAIMLVCEFACCVSHFRCRALVARVPVLAVVQAAAEVRQNDLISSELFQAEVESWSVAV